MSDNYFTQLRLHTPDVIFRYEIFPERRYVYISPSSFNVTGYSPEEFYDDPMLGYKIIHPEDLPIIEKEIMSLTREKCSRTFLRWIAKDGRLVFTEQHTVPVFDRQERLIAIEGLTRDVTKKKQIEMEIRESERKLVALNQQIDQLREDERRTIAHEIHDELGQLLSVMNLDLNLLLKKIHTAAGREILYQLLTINKEAIETVRRIATDLHPSILEQLGLIPAIEWLIREFSKRTGWTCHCSLPDASCFGPGYPGSIGFYRIVQESLTNIARYANASRVEVVGRIEESRFSLSISDNGTGFNVNTLSEKELFGIFGMQQRALALGAKLIITTQPGEGTTIQLSAPYIPDNNDKEKNDTYR